MSVFRWKNLLLYPVVAIFGIVLAYVLLSIFPYPLFPYKVTYKNIAVYSSKPLSDKTQERITKAFQLVSTSELNSNKKIRYAFICNSWPLYRFFTWQGYYSEACTIPLTSNIFFSLVNIDQDQMVYDHRVGVRDHRKRTFSRLRKDFSVKLVKGVESRWGSC